MGSRSQSACASVSDDALYISQERARTRRQPGTVVARSRCTCAGGRLGTRYEGGDYVHRQDVQIALGKDNPQDGTRNGARAED